MIAEKRDVADQVSQAELQGNVLVQPHVFEGRVMPSRKSFVAAAGTNATTIVV